MIRRPPRSTQSRSSAASDVYKRQVIREPSPWLRRDPRETRRRPPPVAERIRRPAGGHARPPAGAAARRGVRPAAPVVERGVVVVVGEVRGDVTGRVAAVGPLAPLLDEAREAVARRSGHLSLIHISEPTRLGMISYAVFCLK